MAPAEAELTSPISTTTLSRSISFCALLTAVAGFTLSSAISSTLRPMTPPDAFNSSTASVAPRKPYSPTWPRKPVRGVRWPMRMTSVCARTMLGNASGATAAAPSAAVFLRASRRPAPLAALGFLLMLSSISLLLGWGLSVVCKDVRQRVRTGRWLLRPGQTALAWAAQDACNASTTASVTWSVLALPPRSAVLTPLASVALMAETMRCASSGKPR